MPRAGEILYALSPRGDLEPVVVKSTQGVARSGPSGEEFPDTMLIVEDNRRRQSRDYAYRFQFVPFISEIEKELEGQKQ